MFTHVWLFFSTLDGAGSLVTSATQPALQVCELHKGSQQSWGRQGPVMTQLASTPTNSHNTKRISQVWHCWGYLKNLTMIGAFLRIFMHFPCLRPLEPVSRVAVFLASMLTFEGCILINTINDQCNLSMSVRSLHPSVPSQDAEALRKDNPQGD